MNIAITGSNGLIGSSLVESFRQRGDSVLRLVRSKPGESDEQTAYWNPSERLIDKEAIQKMDAVIHLAGENIAAGRWTSQRKDRILSSRVLGTRFLSETLAGLENPPGCLLSASAVGYYGDRGDQILDENSPPGSGFLSDVCCQWEQATDSARERGIRVINVRLGMVLSASGGALSKMLPAFRLGLGGPVGSGEQYLSWIGIADVIRAIQHCLEQKDLEGPVNLVSPQPVSNEEFAEILGKVLGKPAILRLPSWVARTVLGEMAQALLLASVRAHPKRLLDSGFAFKHENLGDALSEVICLRGVPRPISPLEND